MKFIKKFVLAWDPDYTKLTASELRKLEESEKNPEYLTQEEAMKELGLF